MKNHLVKVARIPKSRARLLGAFLFSALGLIPLAASENDYPRVYRTFMPEAGPSAFAVELSTKVALTYDPLRGGVNELWTGQIDLSPSFQAKINSPAKIVGTVFYRETLSHPLRLTGPEAAPEHRLKGYRYKKGAVVFEFTLRGRLVTETLRLSEKGDGLIREFALPEGGGPAFFTLEPQPEAKVTVSGGTEIEPGLWEFPAGSLFSILITPHAKETP